MSVAIFVSLTILISVAMVQCFITSCVSLSYFSSSFHCSWFGLLLDHLNLNFKPSYGRIFQLLYYISSSNHLPFFESLSFSHRWLELFCSPQLCFKCIGLLSLKFHRNWKLICSWALGLELLCWHSFQCCVFHTPQCLLCSVVLKHSQPRLRWCWYKFSQQDRVCFFFIFLPAYTFPFPCTDNWLVSDCPLLLGRLSDSSGFEGCLLGSVVFFQVLLHSNDGVSRCRFHDKSSLLLFFLIDLVAAGLHSNQPTPLRDRSLFACCGLGHYRFSFGAYFSLRESRISSKEFALR